VWVERGSGSWFRQPRRVDRRHSDSRHDGLSGCLASCSCPNSITLGPQCLEMPGVGGWSGLGVVASTAEASRPPIL
jgi:hypothetical protein